MKRILVFVTAVWILTGLVAAISQAGEGKVGTGWYWPAGSGDTGGYRGWLGIYDDLQPDGTVTRKYHLAQDFKRDAGMPVYALADGEVVVARTDVSGYGPRGTAGGALAARFRVSDGSYFLALYGHLDRLHSVGKVSAGEVLGYCNDHETPHLHFGVHPGYELPENPWLGYTQDRSNTYGWVDPVRFLLDNGPHGFSQVSETFKPGDKAEVLPGIGLKLRYSHDITPDDSNKTGSLPKDAIVTILEHPDNGMPFDGYYWWYVEYDGQKGWCAEADYERMEVYLSPVSETPGARASIEVEEADVVWNPRLAKSESFSAISGAVSPRVSIEYADSVSICKLSGARELNEAARAVAARIIVEYADSCSFRELQKAKGLESSARAVSPGVIVEYADSSFLRNLGRYTPGAVSERTLSITSAEASPGTSAIIFLDISDATGVAGGDILIRYNADLLAIDQIRGTDLLSGISPVVNRDVPGEIRIGMAGTQGLPPGSGAIVEIEITVNADAQTGIETSLILDSVELYDESGAAVPVNSENGVLRITEPVGIKGDVNGDDQVRSNDAIPTLRIATGLVMPTDEQKWAADMNGDGKVKSNDAILILRRAAGLAAPGKVLIAGVSRQITVMLAEAHGVAGEMVAVPLRVDSTGGIAGGDICVTYDSAILRAVDMSSDCGALMESNMAEPGMVHIAFACLDGLQSKTLAEIRFEALADDVSPLILEHVEFYRSDALPIDTIKVDGKFRSWAVAPERSALFQNYPNPFNPDTWIPYQLKEGSEVTVEIFSLPGNLIRKLNLGYKTAGVYVSQDRTAYWDGRNASGERVASGICFYTIRAGDFAATRKMTIAE